MSAKSTAELIKAADELLKKKPVRVKAVAATDGEEAPKKRAAKVAGPAEAKAPAKRGRKPKAGASAGDDGGDDADLSDIESDLEGEVEETTETTETTATVEKVKPLRMKISKAKERALMKEFGLDETVLSE
ncbi:MAG: RNA polymerase sigma factor RpoD, partial [Burkholderiaceae bacterium]|nr:RNA polymerase sigma factor RpoD [Burkholderiaceae bacterium]